MCLQCDVTKKTREEFSSLPREGAYVHGMYMEGARWDTQVHKAVMSSYCVRTYNRYVRPIQSGDMLVFN